MACWCIKLEADPTSDVYVRNLCFSDIMTPSKRMFHIHQILQLNYACLSPGSKKRTLSNSVMFRTAGKTINPNDFKNKIFVNIHLIYFGNFPHIYSSNIFSWFIFVYSFGVSFCTYLYIFNPSIYPGLLSLLSILSAPFFKFFFYLHISSLCTLILLYLFLPLIYFLVYLRPPHHVVIKFV